jgi:hypothetical protein
MSKASETDAKLDGWLGSWPGPERDESAWEEFGSKLEERLSGLTIGQGEEAWLEPPLPEEPGEGDNAKLHAGGASMSEPESERPKRKSLKDFAQRVSVAPQSDGKPALSAPAADTPVPSSGPRSSSPSLRTSAAFISRPPEARDSDSGILDLNAVRESSLPDTGAQPAQSDLFEEEVKAAPVPIKKKSSMAPVVGGGIVAMLALAAAAVLVLRTPEGSSPMSMAEAPAVAASAATPLATAEPGHLADETADKGLTAEGLAAATATGAPGEAPAPGPARAAADTDEAKSRTATGSKDENEKDEPPPPAGDAKDLAGAMATAVGAGETKKDEAPKSATPTADPGSLPETPSQGAIAGAIGSVRDAARACVAGQTEPSRATITFASNGSVSSVSVGGGAAGTPAAGCIQAALKRARVAPFKKSSFTVGVTVRP